MSAEAPKATTPSQRPENVARIQAKLDARIQAHVPPHDLDAEAAVLSACMLRGDGAAVNEVHPALQAEDFYSEAHRRIFEAIVDLASTGQPVDIVQVAGWLKERGDVGDNGEIKGSRLAQVGGIPYLTQILDAAPVVVDAHLRAYAKRVQNRSRLRRVGNALRVMTLRLYEGVPDEDTEKFFGGLEAEIGALCASRHRGELKPIGPIAKTAMKELRDHDARGGGILGVATGFTRFDKKTGGLHGGDLTIVAARPGLGKTSLVMGICDNVTERDYAAAIFSLEMPKEQLTMRLLCTRAKVQLSKTRTGELHPKEWVRLTLEADMILPRWIHIDDEPYQTWPMIRSKLRRHKAYCVANRKKLAVAMIDFLQLVKTRERKGGVSRSELIGEIARDAKATAKELDISIVLLSQLNRDVERRDDKRPVMSDVRDSGEIEEAADNVVLIYRDDYYDAESEEKNIAELIIGKQRNGPTGTVKVLFDKEWTRYSNLAEYDDERPPEDDGEPYLIEKPEPVERSDLASLVDGP